MRFLLVDDEKNICERMAERIRSMNIPQITEITCAFSAEEAIGLLRQSKYDVLITDICMGDMDGLALIRQAKQLDPLVVCVIISAYNQFEYARQGILMGVHDFWVKPLAREQMRNSIHEMIQLMEDRKAQKFHTLDLMLESAIVSTTKSLTEIFFQNGVQVPQGDQCIVCWEEDRWKNINIKGGWHYHPRGKRYAVACSQQLDNYLVEFSEVLACPVGVSRFNLSIADMYREAYSRTSFGWIYEHNACYRFAEMDEHEAYQWARKAINYATSLEADKAIAEIERVERCLHADQFAIVITLVLELLQNKIQEAQTYIDISLLAKHDAPPPLIGWRAVILQLIAEYRETQRYKVNQAKTNPVLWAQNYAEEHLAQTIDMAYIANQLNMSYPYFSKLFREKSGQSFSEYLQDLRMKQACHLLLQGETIAEISEKVGYKNPNNFSRAFKNTFGISPKHYLKEL